ncbi:MAG: site-specific integrase [Rhodocyclaceae bacterium]|nr:site-specific integrase [Rhodocyclaceae bacterium]MCA3024855.1 site-specific integrase [Rhodocyclaceae bacterium]MCA3032319.1 site-specific integrase [Rhodocyclaceae bacterium]MCA3037852.1 site-specific integrase [Rhodocyclaceae bacterium]MCA3039409.1 site-specific integrase [Rhodocyclaceae bacterium]
MSLYKRKDSSMWWVKIAHGGCTIQRSTGTSKKVAAQEFHDKLKSSLWEQQRLGVKPTRYWKEAVVRWLAETSEKSTHKEDIRKLRWLDVHLGTLSLNEINLDVIDRVKSARILLASKSTANRYLALVRSILRKARDEWEWVEKVPKIKLYREVAGRERSITMRQAETLLRELPKHQRALVLFSLATGLRQKNVLRLKWANVDLQRQHAWVAASHSKNGKPIAVPLNSTAMKVLEEQQGKHPEFVFTYFGKPLNSANTKAWKGALARAEIKDFRWHDLRHTWATWHRQSGTPTHELQRLGGWKTASMVERYAHLAPDHLATAASRIDSSFGKVATI